MVSPKPTNRPYVRQDYALAIQTSRFNGFLGASPQTPRVGFAEVWVPIDFLRSRTTLFASFSGKRRLLAQLFPPQQRSGLALPRFEFGVTFCEAELRFLLLFLEKEEDYWTNCFRPNSRVGFDLLRSRTTLFTSFSGKRML
jgi:hypothetical protein